MVRAMRRWLPTLVLLGRASREFAFVEIDTGDADDTVRVEQSTFQTGLRIRLDDADDFLVLDDLVLDEGADADGGDGDDAVIQRGRILRGPLKRVDLEDFEIRE